MLNNGVIVTTGLILLILFQASLVMGKHLGETTITVMNRVMGLLLAAISVEFILDEIAAHYPNLMSLH